MIFNFFKEDFSEVVGAYFDNEKIYLTRQCNGNVETVDVNFSINHEDDISEIEQLAEKISVICAQRGWKTSKIGFCLREGSVTTFQTQISAVPPNEIENAVKTWAEAQVGKNFLYSYIKSDEEIWMETILKSAAEEYVKAWDKNGMTLCVLTVKPVETDTSINSIKPENLSEFVVEVIANKKTPNLLAERLSTWNYRKISAAVATIFFCIFLLIFAKLSYDYHVASAQLEEFQTILQRYEKELELKKVVDENIIEMKKINSICAAQGNSFPQFNALVKLGVIADGKTRLTKIKTSADSVEIEGVAENTDDIKSYVRRLKTITSNVKPGNFYSADGITNFTIYLTLKN